MNIQSVSKMPSRPKSPAPAQAKTETNAPPIQKELGGQSEVFTPAPNSATGQSKKPQEPSFHREMIRDGISTGVASGVLTGSIAALIGNQVGAMPVGGSIALGLGTVAAGMAMTTLVSGGLGIALGVPEDDMVLAKVTGALSSLVGISLGAAGGMFGADPMTLGLVTGVGAAAGIGALYTYG